MAQQGGIELRHLRYFVALAEEGNFERAAARLAIAQPGLSQQMFKLEGLLGASLLDRSRRSVRLTLAGQVLLEEARRVLRQSEIALDAVSRAARGEAGRISIGYVASAAYTGLLTDILSEFGAAYPNVELHLTEMEMRLQLEKIGDGSLDFGFIRPPAALPSGVSTVTLLNEDFVLALPQRHRFAQMGSITLSLLSAETFIIPRQPPDVGFHSNLLLACHEAGFTPRINNMGKDFTTIASMVAVGLGVALVPRSLECVRLPGITYLPVQACSVTSDLAGAYRKIEPSPTIRSFIAHCRKAATPLIADGTTE
ncbi:LysR substrate-binding domain-containing protein [Rhizobiaceae bacterium n13]|uniref:LysR substrate-binding domain-containing protein n=1 Tax=Ferirhizobium litorale TaxID=2927786 RepID=A0AAE3QEK8_9HYPH|nr:LysR substrate-binding domain-containing protein [Fererhizobium litorale]MDI7861573.1 LysR substrate-binding domain-containing protein [Fererhizobium litorale]MDI7922085.1 LysR substrate-binding domain-containing protein [Fererhizobium litorale]